MNRPKILAKASKTASELEKMRRNAKSFSDFSLDREYRVDSLVEKENSYSLYITDTSSEYLSFKNWNQVVFYILKDISTFDHGQKTLQVYYSMPARPEIIEKELLLALRINLLPTVRNFSMYENQYHKEAYLAYEKLCSKYASNNLLELLDGWIGHEMEQLVNTDSGFFGYDSFLFLNHYLEECYDEDGNLYHMVIENVIEELRQKNKNETMITEVEEFFSHQCSLLSLFTDKPTIYDY